MKFSILIGPDEFNGLKCDLDQPLPPREPEPETEKTANTGDREVRRLVIKTFLVMIVGALVISTGIGLAMSDWSALKTVWPIVALPLGALSAKYIG